MGYFREVNPDDFDRMCAEGDAIAEAREARAGAVQISPEKSRRIAAELAATRKARLDREAAEKADYLANQKRLRDEERAAHAYVRALCPPSDPRDLTPEPPAYLDPRSVLTMQRMVKDASENGDRPWPYTRDAA